MARISGVNLPNKPTGIALTYIHGIGQTIASEICAAVSVDATVRMNELSDDEVGRIREVIDRDHRVEGCLLYTSPSPRDQRGSRMPSSA